MKTKTDLLSMMNSLKRILGCIANLHEFEGGAVCRCSEATATTMIGNDFEAFHYTLWMFEKFISDTTYPTFEANCS